MAAAVRPTVRTASDGWVDVFVPTSAEGRFAKQALVRMLPAHGWRRVQGAMRVDPAHLSVAVAVLEHYFPDVEVVAPEPTGGGESGAALPLDGLGNLPPELAKKLYRAAARVLHPDTGGSEEAFKRLQVWAESAKLKDTPDD